MSSMVSDASATKRANELREVAGYPLYTRLDTSYTFIDLEFNIQPSTQRKCYSVSLFDQNSSGTSIVPKRVRYIYEKDKDDFAANGHPTNKGSSMSSMFYPNSSSSTSNSDGIVGSTLAAFFKTPMTQILASVEEKKRERQARINHQRSQQLLASSTRQTLGGYPQNSKQPSLRKLSEEYFPKDFTDLVGSDKTNRFALKWLKAWDYKVFGKAYPKPGLSNSPDKPSPYFSGGANARNFSNPKKPYKNAQQEQQATYETLSLLKAADIKELNSKMLMLSGPSGCGKSTLATVIAKKCGYNPYKINLASEGGSAEGVIASIKSALEGRSILEATKGPTLLILDDIDGFFSANPLLAQRLVDLITRKPGQNKKDKGTGNNSFKVPPSKGNTGNDNEDEDLEDEKPENSRPEQFDADNNEQSNTRTQGVLNNDPSKAGLFAKRPVIFICDDAYSKGLRPLRSISHWFKLEKNMDSLIERLKVICKHEGVQIDGDLVTSIVTGFGNDISGCLNFLDLVGARAGQKLNREMIESLLKSSSTTETQNKSYYDTMKLIFNKHLNNTMFKSGETNAKKIFHTVLDSLEPQQVLEGVFINYCQCDCVNAHVENSTADLLNSLVDAFHRLNLVKRYQLFQIERYLAVGTELTQLSAMLAYSRFYKRDYMKVVHTSELSTARYERTVAESVFSEMRNALPPSGMAFISKAEYKLELDQIYSIIQPVGNLENSFSQI